MPRPARLTLTVVVKWFSGNWVIVEPILCGVHAVDKGGYAINFSENWRNIMISFRNFCGLRSTKL
jgi:hypothetical protein